MRLRYGLLSVVLTLLFGGIGWGSVYTGHAEPAFVLTVNSTADTSDGACEGGAGDCTLREAILRANSLVGADEIVFDLDDNSTINLASVLPELQETVTIDGADSVQLTINGDDLTQLLRVADGATATVKNLWLINGTAVDGGAVYSEGDLTLESVILQSNSAENKGGALYQTGGSITLIDSSISFNALLPPYTGMDHGGGLYALNTTVTITDSAFHQNIAVFGGGLYLKNSLATIAGSQFTAHAVDLLGNTGQGGAIYQSIGEPLTITDSLFRNNNGWHAGGAIVSDDDLTLDNVRIEQNSAYTGGGLEKGAGDLMVTRSQFSNNNASVARGGGIFLSRSTTPKQIAISDSLFAFNTAHAGGAIYNFGTTATIRNVTFSGNATHPAEETDEGFGGAYFGRCHTAQTVTNCFTRIEHSTFVDNIATVSGGGIYIVDGTGTNETLGHLFLTHTLITDSTGGDCVNGGTMHLNTFNHISDNTCSPAQTGDPNVGPLTDNGGQFDSHALLSGSPAIDAGDAAVSNPPITDVRGDGFPRINNSRIDIGAFEFQQTCWATPDNGTNVLSGDSASVVRESILLAGAGGTVKVAGNCPGVSGDHVLAISADLTLTGGYTVTTFTADDWLEPVPDTLTTFDAENNGRVIAITGLTTDVTLANLKLVNGDIAGNGGGLLADGNSLTATQLWITDNQAINGGGFSSENGTVTLDRSAITDNQASTEGGGLYLVEANTTIINTTISGNNVLNQSQHGAGIYGEATVNLYNVTVAKNGSAELHNGIFNDGTMTLYNTLVVDNVTLDAQCSGIGMSAVTTGSVDDDNSCGGAYWFDGLDLPALAFNGGATPSHLPDRVSFTDFGSDAICNGALVGGVDQRGYTRTVCDTGAIEKEGAIPTVIHLQQQAASTATSLVTITAFILLSICTLLIFHLKNRWVGA